MKLKLNFFLFLLIATINLTFGQELDSITMSYNEGTMVVRYNLIDADAEQEYELFLYGSHDNFETPFQETTGDVGKGIKAGNGKIIYWNVEKELGVFKGDLSLKIKGGKYIPFVEYQNIDPQLKLKRGELFNIQWKANDKTDQILLELKRNGVPIEDPMIVDNSGNYEWRIPTHLKPGKGFTVQIKDIQNNLREETSPRFAIRRKVPVGYIVIPAAVVTGGLVYFLSRPEDASGIPEPPSIPGIN